MDKPVGILYEHPLWFEPLFAELDRRGVAYEKLHVGELVFDPGEREIPYSLLVNRMSPSAWTRGQAHAIFYAERRPLRLAFPRRSSGAAPDSRRRPS